MCYKHSASKPAETSSFMKRCPSCNRNYTDTSLNFCLEDGTLWSAISRLLPILSAIRYPEPHHTGEPPVTEIYPAKALLNPVPEISQPRPGSPRASRLGVVDRLPAVVTSSHPQSRRNPTLSGGDRRHCRVVNSRHRSDCNDPNRRSPRSERQRGQ